MTGSIRSFAVLPEIITVPRNATNFLAERKHAESVRFIPLLLLMAERLLQRFKSLNFLEIVFDESLRQQGLTP